MRLLIVLPQQPEATGNFVTARRLQSGLIKRGVEVELFAIDQDKTSALTSKITQFRPDHLLLLHAWKSGRFWLESSAVNFCPATVLLTGTDINHDVNDSIKGPVIEKVLHHAAAIVSQNQETVNTLLCQKPAWIDRLHYIPPGVSLGTTLYPLRKLHGIQDQCKLFLHPAGIRPVKANLEILKLCDKLAEHNRNFTLAFCGPELDPAYFQRFIIAVNKRPWAHYLGVIQFEAMPNAMTEADVILNNSISEGVSNALLEALTVGCQVLARNIPGNASIHPACGDILLYNSEEEFFNIAQQLISKPHPEKHSKYTIFNKFSAETEVDGFATLLKSL